MKIKVGDKVRRKATARNRFWQEIGPRNPDAILTVERVFVRDNALYFEEMGSRTFTLSNFELVVDNTVPLEDFL